MVCLPLREHTVANGEVQAVGVEIVQKLRGVDIVQPQMDTGRDLAQVGEEGRDDQDFHAVGQPHAEGTLRRARIECFVSGYEDLDLGQCDPHRLDQSQRAGGGTQSLRTPRQELVAEEVP